MTGWRKRQIMESIDYAESSQQIIALRKNCYDALLQRKWNLAYNIADEILTHSIEIKRYCFEQMRKERDGTV